MYFPFFPLGTRWITHKLTALQLLVDKFGLYLQHLQTMSEDKSFKAADRQKFKGWLRKWQQARIPLTACLFIELLSPAKALSLAFQDDEIDIVATVGRIATAKKQLERLERKDFLDLPTVKRFLEKIEERDFAFQYQNVNLPSFEPAKESARRSKNMLLGRIKEAMETRLEVAENRNVVLASTVLNCEGWEKKDEYGEEDLGFADDVIAELYNHFKEPLSKAGLNGTLNDLLDQWHDLLNYTIRYLDPTRTPYLRVWRRIFDSSRRAQWSMVLILVELLFCIPISNAKVERLFSLMNRVKTDCRASLGESSLNHLIRIRMEGPAFQDYDSTPAIQSWLSSAARRPNQKARKQYKSRDSVKKLKVLIDDSSTEESAEEEEEMTPDHDMDAAGEEDDDNVPCLIRELDELD